jgi:SM-20-related protein
MTITSGIRVNLPIIILKYKNIPVNFVSMNQLYESIADGLAEQGYAIIDQFLSQSEVADIVLAEFDNPTGRFRKAGIGKKTEKQINESIRGDLIQWVDRETASRPVAVYLQRLNDLIHYLNQSLFLSLRDYEVHMTAYPPGSFYKRHLDQFKKDDHRKLSVICYLNDAWKAEQGGQLRMHLENGPMDVLPTAGKLVCFRSDQIEHEVLPATRERLSLTGWILDQHLELYP